MNTPGQLLDSSEEPVEYIEKKWLVPLLFMILCFPYLFFLVQFTLPDKNFFEAMGYVPVVTNIFYLAGALLYDFLKQKKWVIYVGLVCLMVFCLWIIQVFLGSGFFENELHLYLLAAGAGLCFYPLVSLFLKDSLPAYRRQRLLIVALFIQFILHDLINFRGGQYILSEEIGVFPLLICLVLFLISLLYLVSAPSSPSIEQKVNTTNFPKFSFRIPLLLSLYYIFVSMVINLSTSIFPPGTPHADVSQFHVYNGSVGTLRGFIPCIILFILSVRKIRFSYENFIRIGILFIVLPLLLEVFSHFLLKDLRLPVLFLFISRTALFVGLAFIIMGLFSSFMQYCHHRYYASILALPVIPLTTSFIPFWIPFNDDIVYLLFYSSLSITLVLSVFFYLYLNRKTKTIPHEPPRHEP